MAKKTRKWYKKQCDKLWQKCVKARAGYRSEMSGTREGRMVGHHVMKKPNLFLRYNLDNGMCVTTGEHFAIHYKGAEWLCYKSFIVLRGEHLLEALDSFRSINIKDMPEWTLEGKYDELKEELKKWES